MTNKLKRNESYYQLKYSNNKYSDYHDKSNSRQTFIDRERENPTKNSWKARAIGKKY